MEKEISSGTMLGIVLIALAVIIALGFGIFAIAKGTANEGVTKVQTNLANVQASEFTDYDQTVVTGTQVKSALSNFEGKSVAILVVTNAWLNCPSNGGTLAYAGAKNTANQAHLPKVKIGNIGGATTAEDVAINYNALLSGITLTAGTYTGTGQVTLKDGKYICTTGFYTQNGAVQFYNVIGDMSKSGMTEYVDPGAKFSAHLIEDASGTKMGIVFIQIKSN